MDRKEYYGFSNTTDSAFAEILLHSLWDQNGRKVHRLVAVPLRKVPEASDMRRSDRASKAKFSLVLFAYSRVFRPPARLTKRDSYAVCKVHERKEVSCYHKMMIMVVTLCCFARFALCCVVHYSLHMSMFFLLAFVLFFVESGSGYFGLRPSTLMDRSDATIKSIRLDCPVRSCVVFSRASSDVAVNVLIFVLS